MLFPLQVCLVSRQAAPHAQDAGGLDDPRDDLREPPGGDGPSSDPSSDPNNVPSSDPSDDPSAGGTVEVDLSLLHLMGRVSGWYNVTNHRYHP